MSILPMYSDAAILPRNVAFSEILSFTKRVAYKYPPGQKTPKNHDTDTGDDAQSKRSPLFLCIGLPDVTPLCSAWPPLYSIRYLRLHFPVFPL